MSWRLDGSFPKRGDGPRWLADAQIAEMVASAILFGDPERYRLRAWVIMPDHVHVVIDPKVALSEITHWLKGRTARKANRILARYGRPFWQNESFDHWIRSDAEFCKIVDYVENNPVRAGLVRRTEDWRWSSAWGRKSE